MMSDYVNEVPHVGPENCRVGSAPFPGRRSYKATNHGFSFSVYFVLLYSRVLDECLLLLC